MTTAPLRRLRLASSAVTLCALALFCLPLPVRAEGKPTPAGWKTYADTALGFTIAYPPDWSVDPARKSPGPDADIPGVAFDIPASLAKGTNLSADRTGVTVDHVDAGGACTAARFLADPQDLHDVTDRTGTWSVATMTDAGAGQYYDMTVYARKGPAGCLAVRYVIHSSNIENYEPGAVKPFDRAALVALFDKIRATFAIR
ncbi:MAG: hypothetical protein KGN76_16070 [Acidobacteriota bacterium]|nr:hypothetical protein [Acidobacteriota bacterium]